MGSKKGKTYTGSDAPILVRFVTRKWVFVPDSRIRKIGKSTVERYESTNIGWFGLVTLNRGVVDYAARLLGC